MTINFETFSTNMKATFDNMEKYGEGISKQEKIRTILEKIRTTNNNLESETTFYRSNNNGNYLAATNCPYTQIRFIFPEHKPNNKKNHDRNKKCVTC